MCLHLEVRPWEAVQRLLGDGTILHPGVQIRFGGWRCVACGEKFYPRTLVAEAILKHMREDK
jgi:hypothetical protein